MAGPLPGERQLVPNWSYGLIALSYCISWLGAYTSTQIVIHAKYSRTKLVRWVWFLLASIAFGFTGIWSMHFVGMLACRLDVKINYDIPLTILSALVAIVFTFAAFTTAYISDAIQQIPLIKGLSSWKDSYSSLRSALFVHKQHIDIESGRRSRASSRASDERRPMLASTSDHGDNDDDEDEEEHARRISEHPEDHEERPHLKRSYTFPGPAGIDIAEETPETGHEHSTYASPSQGSTTGGTLRAPFSFLRRTWTPPVQGGQVTATAPVSARTSEDSSTPLTTDSSDDSVSITQRLSGSSAHSMSTTPTSLSTRSWSDPLHAGLSREARIRIKAQARDKPVPNFGWRYWVKRYYATINVLVFVRAGIWGLAIIFMHYCGMWAMQIPQGRIEWNSHIVALSYIVAFIVCFLACVAMVHVEVHFGRQVAFSTIAAGGVCSMHYTGMVAASFYTSASPSDDPGYPAFLPFTILAVAAIVCVISNALLAHSAILSRNQMAEVILTKRRLWRIMAEKEAAEQANELKQQFISVASHEIRTPLHAVNGYCDLLAMTQLTEEQAAYVSSIQQACYAINVIAGNVLDFSKLDRDNVELSARPVLVDLRKMVEDQARIIETRALNAPHPVLDVIVSVDNNVPDKVYLDETYTYRILMNLLSNAQKFCEEGYICVHVSMDSPSQVAIKISDSGCGIPKSFRHALFQPFRQADTSFTRPKQGTGLGLSIVKHLVQRMSGSVDVESAEGEGSTFTVKLPITVPTSAAPLSDVKPPKRRLKIIHRNERTAQVLADMWARLGMAATVVSHDTSLGDVLKDTDAIITDVESVQRSTALMKLMSAELSYKSPPVYLVHSGAQELSSLEPKLSQAHGVVLVKRPIVVHGLLALLSDPALHLDSIFTPKVRFAIPTGKTPQDERKVELLSPATLVDVEGSEIAKHKILLVEDNMVNQHLGKRLLERLGYEVETADNGQQAVDKVLRSSFYCCFMDCQMPVLDGFAATVRIRELESNGTLRGSLPIIALTANVGTDSEEKCRAAGMNHFLPKPFKLTDLQATLANLYNTAASP